MELLESLEDRGYPFEYLLSRIRGRRSKLIRDWNALIYDIGSLEYLYPARYRGFVTEKSPEGIWKVLIREFRWVYTQMNEKLREIFCPFFSYSELRTLFICLRHLRNRKTGRTQELLAVSLISESIKHVLLTSEDIPSAVSEIEQIFLSLSDRFTGLTETLESEGLRGVEQQLTNSYLVHTINTGLHPVIRTFFVRIIDSRNIMSLYKYLRLNAKKIPFFISGGSIDEARLREVREKEDLLGIRSLIYDFAGIRLETFSPSRVEHVLYTGITRLLKKEGREPLGVGLILDYLWRCSIEAMNLGVLMYGKGLERDLIAVELIQ